MKPTLSNLEKRIEAIEQRPGVAPEEPLIIQIQYVDHQGKQLAPATEWTTSHGRNPETGQEIIVEWPVYNGAARAT